MIIEVPKVSPRGSRYEGEEPANILDLEPRSGVEPESALAYTLEAKIVSRDLVVWGSIEMFLRLQCSRCAVFFSTTVRNSSFLRVYPLHAAPLEIDVTADLREDLLLGLPKFPRCRKDCAGLCPYCGANLNKGSCSCVPRAEKGPWDSLDNLFDRAML